MFILCPTCRKQLQVPDDAAGKQVRCPLCQGVFTATAIVPAAAPIQAVAVTPLPPPLPPADESLDDSRRRDERRPYYLDDEPVRGPGRDFAFGRADDDGMGRIRAQAYLNSGAGWMRLAAALILITATMGLVTSAAVLSMMGGLPRVAAPFLVGMFLGVMVFYGVPAIFIFVGASHLARAGTRGLAITGLVFLYIVFGILSLSLLFALMEFGTRGAIHALQIIQFFLACATDALTLTAAIKVQLIINRPDLKRAFASYDPERRARNYDEETEWERRRLRERDDRW